MTEGKTPVELRSRAWFNNPASPDMTALYLERYLNYGLSIEELQSDRPIIGIAQTGSDLSPCNRHHLVLADRVKDGIREAGGIPIEFPIHPIHLNAIARHAGVELTLADWEAHGADVPLLVNLQPAGEYLGEDYFRAVGVPAVMGELQRAGLLFGEALTVNGRSLADNVATVRIRDEDVIRPLDHPLKAAAGLTVLTGNLFEAAVMKTSVISEAFRARYLSNPDDPEAFEGRVVVFDGPEDYHHRINDPALVVDVNTVLVIRGAGPIGYPGGAEVVNMAPPAALIRAGVEALPCIGDGRQSGTSGSPSILNASPEAAVGGGLALLRDGDRIRISLKDRRADLLVSEEEMARRRADLEQQPYAFPESQTPWQEIHRRETGQFATGAVLESAVKYQRVAQVHGVPRDSH